MSVFKQFLSQDIIVTPFPVNKNFTILGDNFVSSNIGIDRYVGTNYPLSSSGDLGPTTGFISTGSYQFLVYNSIKELYYSNYLNSTASLGSPVVTASLIPGANKAGDVLVGPTSSAGRYWNYPQTTLTFEHYYPTSSNSYIGVFSIPVGLFGNYIQPGTFNITSDSGSIYDDGQGNLIFESTNAICGQIFYPHGLAVITSDSQPQGDTYGTAILGSSLYGLSDTIIVENFITSSNITCSFSSSLTIYETQFKCTAGQNEFNFSQNPTISSGSTTITSSIGDFITPGQYIYSFATSSYFSPYITTVGLYNDNNDLLAVAKLATPLQISPVTDMTIQINIDM